MSDAKFNSLNDAEIAWVGEELARARQYTGACCPEDPEASMNPETLDRVFKMCREAKPDDNEVNNIINAVGIAFGHYLVENLPARWYAVTDQYGCDLAVAEVRGDAQMFVCPTNLVAKRWQDGTTDFLSYVFTGIMARQKDPFQPGNRRNYRG